MQNYAVSSSLKYAVGFATDNALLQLRYLFGFTLFFHINKIHLVNAPTD